ncbi:MAG: extracellular solute-binding protein [Clostridia bacterium]|nr:extracellular solute-binding protein [Clostridia bacterium]
MKKITSLILAALLLVSCTADTQPGETEETAATGYLYPMEDFEVTRIDHYLSTSLTETAQIAEFRAADDCGMWTSAPMVQIVGDKTYVMRRFPAEIIGFDNIHQFAYAETTGDHVNQIEIYSGGNYGTPSQVIPLTGHADKMLRFDEFEYLPDSDTFVTLQVNYHIDLPQVFIARTFDGEGKMLTEKEFAPPSMDPEQYPFIDMRLMGGDLYFMKQETSLYRYDIDSGTETVVNGGINGYTVSDGKIVYVRHATNADYELEYRICEYDPAQDLSFILGKLACDPKGQLISRDTWLDIAYDRENKILYYSPGVSSANMPRGIRAAKLNDEKFVQVLTTSESMQFIKWLEISGGQLMMQVGNNQILLYEVPDTPTAFDAGVQELNFCLFSMDLTTADNYQSDVFRLMEMSGTSAKAKGTVVIQNLNSPDEYISIMAKKLLAGDTDFDIFIVTNDMMSLLKEEYYEDLSQYRLIDESVNDMIPGVKELCTVGNTLALCPIVLTPQILRVQNDRIASGYTPPSSFAELVNLAGTATLSGNNVKLMSGYTHLWMVLPWFNQYAANFMARTVDDTQAKADLTGLYRNAAELLTAESVAYGEEANSLKSAMTTADNYGKSAGVPAGQSVLPIVPAAGGYRQAVEGTFYAVNPNSPNKELAAEFLACVLEKDWMKNGQLYNLWDENVTYQEGSEITYALYMEQIADSVLQWTIPGLNEYVGEPLTDIISGTLTPEDAAEELFRYLKMIRDE